MLELEMPVSPSDLDQVYGHVHHAKSLTFLEAARLELLRRLGFASDLLIKRDLFPVVTRIDVHYRREVGAGNIRVTCEQGRIAGKTMYLTQQLVNEKGKPALLAQVECMLLQGSSKRAAQFPADFLRSFAEFFGEGADN